MGFNLAFKGLNIYSLYPSKHITSPLKIQSAINSLMKKPLLMLRGILCVEETTEYVGATVI
jgi:hypothetical protein